MSESTNGDTLSHSGESESVLSDAEIKALEGIAILRRKAVAKLLTMTDGRKAYFKELYPYLTDAEREAFMFVPDDSADIPDVVEQIPSSAYSAATDLYLIVNLDVYAQEAAAIRAGDPDAPVDFYANFYDQLIRQEQAAQ